MEQEDPDSLVVQNMLEAHEDLQKIRYLKPLLNWAHLVNQIWGNKISQEDSLENSIKEMIMKLANDNYTQQQDLLIEDVEGLVKEVMANDTFNFSGNFKGSLKEILQRKSTD